ncbi:MAG: hypothetical protein WDN72_10745 [Alphaproteobacteria bacterium]
MAGATGRALEDAAIVYFELGAQLKLGWLRRTAHGMPTDNYWQQLAVKSLVVELYAAQRRLTGDVIRRAGKKKGDAATIWIEASKDSLTRYLSFIEDLRTQQSFDYPMMIVALRQVQWITSQ